MRKYLSGIGFIVLLSALITYAIWDAKHSTEFHLIIHYLDGTTSRAVMTIRNNQLRPILEAGCIKWYGGNTIECGVRSFEYYSITVKN
jgi:hypothetical protein